MAVDVLPDVAEPALSDADLAGARTDFAEDSPIGQRAGKMIDNSQGRVHSGMPRPDIYGGKPRGKRQEGATSPSRMISRDQP